MRKYTDVVLIPPKSPNCNAHAERFVRSIKEECLDRLILFGEKPLRRAIREYVCHFHAERNHPSAQALVVPAHDPRIVLAKLPPTVDTMIDQSVVRNTT